MINFRTQYDHTDIVSEPGVGEAPDYMLKIDENGREVLEQVGVINTYAQIQSYKDACDINNILARYASGDASVLSERQGMFFDATKFPDTFRGMLDAIVQGEQIFNSLPLDVKAEFGFDFGRWVAGMDNITEWNEKMKLSVSHEGDSPSADKDIDNKE